MATPNLQGTQPPLKATTWWHEAGIASGQTPILGVWSECVHVCPSVCAFVYICVYTCFFVFRNVFGFVDVRCVCVHI